MGGATVGVEDLPPVYLSKIPPPGRIAEESAVTEWEYASAYDPAFELGSVASHSSSSSEPDESEASRECALAEENDGCCCCAITDNLTLFNFCDEGIDIVSKLEVLRVRIVSFHSSPVFWVMSA